MRTASPHMVWAYLVAVYKSWVGLASGVLGIGAAATAAIWPNLAIIAFWLAMVLAFVVAPFAAWATEHAALLELQTRVVGDDQLASKKAALEDGLGMFLAEGQKLMNACVATFDKSEPAPLADAESWNQRAHDFLRNHLGAAHVARFTNGSGLPMGMSHLAGEHVKIWSGLRIRTARLEQFLQELASR